MGVLACDRSGCENVMCDRLSYHYNAYLCDECFDELVDRGVEASVQKFLDSEKAKGPNREARREAALARFDAEFPKRTDW